MATMEDKENLSPLRSVDLIPQKGLSPLQSRTSRKGRSKSIGPGGLDDPDGFFKKDAKQEAKNRRKSTYIPATKSIMASHAEKAERQAARRATLANRRVSFAPEATLHTWDVIEFARDQTTSTDSTDSTRRASNITRSSHGGSPFKRPDPVDSDPPSTPPEQADEPAGLPASPVPQRGLHQKKRRRSSGIPPMNFNNPDDAYSSSGVSGSSDDSENENDDLDSSEGEDTDTAMSLETEDNTARSMAGSEGSTGSSARLEAALRDAAVAAGTRGIEYDEFGDQSMELAAEGITNAFQPWAVQQASNQPTGSASFDQENVNPFSPAFKAKLASGTVSMPSTVAEEDTGELSMDETRAVGGIFQRQIEDSPSSQLGDGTMDLTQAVGQIQNNAQERSAGVRASQKRRRSTTNAGSPGASVSASHSKRRKSSVAFSSVGDEALDSVVTVGGVQNTGSPSKSERRKSIARRRSSGVASEQDDATMDFTQAVGGIRAEKTNHTSSSFDENEELTMELTTVFGSINAAHLGTDVEGPSTPQRAQSPLRSAANTTPKDQERFKDAPEEGPKKLLTPLFQKQVAMSPSKISPAATLRAPSSPAIPGTRSARAATRTDGDQGQLEQTERESPSPAKASPARRSALGSHKSPLRASPTKSPGRKQISTTPDSLLRQQVDAQLQDAEASPTVQKQQRSSPMKVLATPDKVIEPTHDSRRLAESIKLLSTPRKETLKAATPKKQTPATQRASPARMSTPRNRPQPKGKNEVLTSPGRHLRAEVEMIQSNERAADPMRLQDFLDLAGVRFMDLTTTKRRMTTVPTPSKVRKSDDAQDDSEADFESAIVAGACTVPELEMYEHACHELKRYISDGKKVIREIESETTKSTPPLLQVYTVADSERRATLDAQMRDIKTHARLRSKEMWYAWRSQLLEDLMKGLSGIAEGLITDDETIQHREEILDQLLPPLQEKHDSLQVEADTLEREAAAIGEDEKEELENARERLQAANHEIEEKQSLLAELQRETHSQEEQLETLEESKEEFVRAIEAADQVKSACRGLSVDEVATLKESIEKLERSSGWSITSASASPPTTTMTYRSQLQLFFHPTAFNTKAITTADGNAPISLTHTALEPLSTSLRFFLQFLQASLQALPQHSTRVSDLLAFVGKGWDTALDVAEAERQLGLQGLTETCIKSDERLSISALILLPLVQTKVRIGFDVLTAINRERDEGPYLGTSVEMSAKVVYGEPYNEVKMREFIEKEVTGDFTGWDTAIGELRQRLVARGRKVPKN